MSRNRKPTPKPEAGALVTHPEIIHSLLGAAVRSFFIEQNMMAASCLAGAARELIQKSTLSGKSIHTKMLEIAQSVQTDVEELRKIKNRLYNKTKHFRADGEDDLSNYNFRETESILLEACIDFLIEKGPSLEAMILIGWMIKRYDLTDLAETFEPMTKFVSSNLIRDDDYALALKVGKVAIQTADKCVDDHPEVIEHSSLYLGATIDKLVARGANAPY